jgi:hypothetical protein
MIERGLIMSTDNIRIEFNLLIPENTEDIADIIGQPIMIDMNPVGVVTEAVIDDSKQYYQCKGVIWDRFVKPEYFTTSIPKLAGIHIGL